MAFKEISSDLEGFWTGVGKIVVRPIDVNLSDNKADKSKANILINCELVEDPEGQICTKDGEVVDVAPGGRIGVWYSPGMRPILNCAGVDVVLKRDESKDKDTGKPKPMKGYRLATDEGERGERLEVAEDYRKESKNAKTPWSKSTGKKDAKPSSEEDVPF